MSQKVPNVSIGFNSGEYNGKHSRWMLSGTTNAFPCWCQPAPSQAVCDLRADFAKCRFIISVLAPGVMIAAPTPRFGPMAPKM
jgi:hypothetical protein